MKATPAFRWTSRIDRQKQEREKSDMSTASPNSNSRSRRSKRGQVSLMVIGVVILAVLAIVVAAVMKMKAGPADARGVADTAVVRNGMFDITLPVSGELAALKQIEIRNKVDGRAVINEIVAEGTNVSAGDVVLRLNDDEIKDKWRQVKEKVNTANAAYVTAMAELTNTQNERNAELAKADSAIKLANLALQAWLSGEDPSKHQEMQLALETADKDYTRLQERFVESGKLLERKFLSLDEYKRDEIAMIEARSALAKAKLDLEAYEKYQSLHDKAEKESDLEQANLDRKRVEDKFTAEVQSAEIEVESKKFQLESAKEDLARLDEQLTFCVVTAPSAGLVVYTSSLQQGGMGRNEGRPPVVGTELSKNESVMILPDVSQMIASVKVSESLSGTIRPGQRAMVTSDANPNRTLAGEVLSVGVLAESGGWRDPNRRDYTVKILLKEGYDLGLKPSMRCKAEIYVGRVSDALHVPIQAVFRNGPINYVYVPQDGGYAQKQVTIGRASELFIEIKEGLTENQIVLLREPATEEITYRLPVPKQEEKPMVAEIGEAPEAMPAGMRGGQGGPANGRPGGAPQGGPANGRPGGMPAGAGDGSGMPRGDGANPGGGGGRRRGSGGGGGGGGGAPGSGGRGASGDAPASGGGSGAEKNPAAPSENPPAPAIEKSEKP